MQAARVKIGNVRLKATGATFKRADTNNGNPFRSMGGPSGYGADSIISPRVADWLWNGGSPNDILSGSLPVLRGRSREAYRKDGLANDIVSKHVDDIVSDGITPQWNTPNAAFNAEAAALFNTWADECDADGRHDFYGMQAFAVTGMCVDGDNFTRMRARRPEDNLSVPLQLQILPGDMVPVEFNDVQRNIRNGIQFSPIGAREFYHMYRTHPGESGASFNDLSQVPANEVAHLALVPEPGVIRGEPWLTRALIHLRDFDQFFDAVLMKQKVSNLFAGFVSPSADGVFPWDEETGEIPNAQGIAIAPLEPGAMQVLPAGSDVKFANPPDVGQNFEPFVKACYQRLASTVHQLYEQVSGDYKNVNDRTWRAAINQANKRIRRIQYQIVVYQWCRPVIAKWAEYAVGTSAIKLPPGVTFKMLATPKWLATVQPYINPVQDVQAKRDEVRAGFKSRKQTVSESGWTVDQIDKENAEDNQRADSLGVAYDSDARRTLTTGVAVEDFTNPTPDLNSRTGV